MRMKSNGPTANGGEIEIEIQSIGSRSGWRGAGRAAAIGRGGGGGAAVKNRDPDGRYSPDDERGTEATGDGGDRAGAAEWRGCVICGGIGRRFGKWRRRCPSRLRW